MDPECDMDTAVTPAARPVVADFGEVTPMPNEVYCDAFIADVSVLVS